MNEDERFAMLDRRAATATGALDEAVAQVPVPEPDFGSPSRGMRRFLPMAVAAGLAVIALVGAALVFDDGDEQATVAGQPEGVTRLALPDPEALGYRIVGAFDSSTAADLPDGLDLTMTVQSPVGADDPWESTVVSWSIPTDMTTLNGEAIDVDGVDAALRTDNGVVSVGWIDGDRVRYVRSADRSADDLVGIVRETADAGISAGEPLPGHEVIHTAPHTDLYPLAAVGVTTGDMGGIAYESDGGALVVATGPGSESRWKVTYALAVGTESVTVRGRDAVRADFGDGMTEVSWLEADGTLVRAGAYDMEVPVDLLDHLEPLADAEFTALVAEHGDRSEDAGGDEAVEGPVEEIPRATIPDRGASTTTVDERSPLAEVSIGDEDFTLRAVLLRAPDGSIDLETTTEYATGSDATVQDLADTSTNVVVRDPAASERGGTQREMVAGVIGPTEGMVEFVDPATGERFDPVGTSGPSHANIPDSDYVLFLGTIAPEHRGRPIAVVTTSPTGDQIRLDA